MKHSCCYCKGDLNYHKNESDRITKEIENLSDNFKEGGIVRTILRERIEQEKKYSEFGNSQKLCHK